VRTLIANGNYRRGAALLGFNHLKRLKNEWPLVFEYAALPGENEDAFTNRLAGELEQANLDAGPGTIGAIIAEPVSVSSGMFPPPASYFTRITSVSHTYGVQLFIDEVVPGYATRDQAPR
jgi:adenosylmethionine-8-amino-7-oxononanoate aminotransferase